MIFLPMLVLAAACLAPALLMLWRPGRARTRRDSAIALHRTQLADLERDLAEGRLAPAEHASAVLEVKRRLLRAADAPDAPPERRSGTLLVAALGLIPAAALTLYLIGGSPGMPSVPHAAMVAIAQRRAAEEASLETQLVDHLKALDPASPQAHQGYVMLGELAMDRGDPAAAVAAWKTALASGFDPTLAARTADAMAAAAGRVTPAAAALFRQALAAAPADAPWRAYAQQKLAAAGS